MNKFRQGLLNKKFMIGTEIQTCYAGIAEIFALAGYDFVWIDMEHSSMDYQQILAHIIAARAGVAASLVRIPWNEPYLAKRVLEMGPDGIIFPMISSYEDAKKAIDSCIYPPDGKRGLGPIRANQYGLNSIEEYIKNYTDITCRLLQIENAGAVKDLDRILEIPYLDGLILGPFDLSGSIGKLGDIYCEENMELIDITIAKCRRKGMPIGVAGVGKTDEDFRFWLDKGIRFISCGGDLAFMTTGAKTDLTRLNGVLEDMAQKKVTEKRI